jgi:hypothetical protein
MSAATLLVELFAPKNSRTKACERLGEAFASGLHDGARRPAACSSPSAVSTGYA